MGKRGKGSLLRTIGLVFAGLMTACCGLGAIGAVISPSPKVTVIPVTATSRNLEPADVARVAGPPSATETPWPTAAIRLTVTPFPTAEKKLVLPTPSPSQREVTRGEGGTATFTARPAMVATAIPTKPPATFMPKPAPTAAALPTAIPAPAAPVFAQEGPSRQRVDPAWWPCTQGQVKGNNKSRIYHAPGQRDYAYTFADVHCFNSEAEAVAGGFRRAQR